MITIMVVWGIGIRDISAVLSIRITKVLKVLRSTKYRIKPKKAHYDCLETDEFWTYEGKEKNNGLSPGKGEIVAFVGGKQDLKTVQKLRKRIKRLWISYERIATDD